MRVVTYKFYERVFLCFIVISLLSFPVSVEAEQNNIKIVSLSPCLTEIIFKLGKGNALVGRSSACDYPEEVMGISIAGRLGHPFMETLLLLKPDIVVTASLVDTSVQKSVQEYGMKFQLLPTESIDDYFNAVEHIGTALECEEQAAAEIARVRDGLTQFLSELNALPEADRPLVYLEVWNRPRMTVGKKSFINDCITYAGGKNIAGTMDKEYFACSEEWVISSNPQIIIAPSMGKGCAGEIRDRKSWGNVSAVRNNRIYVALDSNLIFRLGPRVLEGIELLKNCIQAPVTDAGNMPKKVQ